MAATTHWSARARFSNAQINKGRLSCSRAPCKGCPSPLPGRLRATRTKLYSASRSARQATTRTTTPDVIVVPRYTAGDTHEGSVFIFHGSLPACPAPPPAAWKGIRSTLASALQLPRREDLDGDGFSDIAIGAPLYDNETGAANEGAVFVYFGSAGGLSPVNRSYTYSGEADSDFGVSVATAAIWMPMASATCW